jgi:AraC-like DNA-binding protein
MKYREIAPIPQLAGAVQCLWLLEGQVSGIVEAEPVLPDGRPELILHFGDSFERVSLSGESVGQPSMIFAGQLTSRLLLRPTGQVAVLGVRFHPHGVSGILPMPQDDLVGLTLDVGSLSGRLARDLALVECSTGLSRAAADVQRVLVRWLQPGRLDARVRFAVETIERTRGLISVEALAHAGNMTRRHLERRFLEDVGTTPKRLARITRFQHALRILNRLDSRNPGVETAARCGYSDQSHFIREFRQLAGCSPSEHLLHRARITGFFVDGSCD